MKTTKRIFACLLIVVMLASMLCVGASAININGIDGVTYTVYKVFDLESTGTAVLYTWPSAYNTEQKTAEIMSHLTETTTVDSKTYVELKTNSEAAAIAFAEEVVANTKFAVAATNAGTFTATLADGYYVMANDANNTVVAFSVIGGKVLASGTYSGDTITAKGGLPTINKTVNDTIVAMNQTLTYTITVEAEKNAANYVLTDNIPAGLKNVTLSAITRNGTDIKTALAGETSVSDTQIKVDFTDYLTSNPTAAGDKFVLTYTAIVDIDATIGSAGNKNTATLEYGTSKKIDSSATVYTSKISFTKYITGTTTPLAGAKFVLMNEASEYAQITAGVVTAWVATQGDATPIESTTTEVVINGLAEGVYTLKETDAPAGYMIVNENTTVTIPNDKDNANFVPAMAEIYNTPGNPLPETGGIGTTVFYAVGGCLVLGALVILLMKKRTVA